MGTASDLNPHSSQLLCIALYMFVDEQERVWAPAAAYDPKDKDGYMHHHGRAEVRT